MSSKRTGRLLAALGCAAIVSLVAPVAAQATEAARAESTLVETAQTESVETAESDAPVFIPKLRPASADEEYSFKVEATAPADTSLTFMASGLPEGYSMAPDGLITGKLDAPPGNYDVTFTATAHHHLPDRAPVSSSVTWLLSVAGPERPILTQTVLPPATHDTPYSSQVQAKAPTARPSLTFTASGLPDGYSMTPGGLISGMGKPGTFTATIGVTAHAPGRPSVAGESKTVTFEVLKGEDDGWWDGLGRHHKIVYDGWFRDLPWSKTVRVDCPAVVNPSDPYAPWLDVRTGTDGVSVGQGVIANSTVFGGLAFQETSRRSVAFGFGKAYSGMDIDVPPSFFSADPDVYIEMVCTNNPQYAWKG